MQDRSEKTEGTADSVQFAVLFHRHPEGDHYDLLIEEGPQLATWRLLRAPELTDATGIDCERLPDHRRLYLTYEGPITGDRGDVTRYDSGRCRRVRESPGSWTLTFEGIKLKGSMKLAQSQSSSSHWSLRRLA